MRDLTRARWRQELARSGWTGLFLGLVCATVAVLLVRLAQLPFPVWQAAGVALAVPLLGAVAVALRRRPDALRVAIDADLRLNLKQQLSTAWEVERDGGGELAERLAAQAVRARLPSRGALVFPARISTPGMLTPVAAVLLVLVAVVEPGGAGQEQAAADAGVVSEGARLRDFGRRMEDRARRETLPRSAGQAQQLQRLGNRMHSGSLSRRQALARLHDLDGSLDAEQRRALGEGHQTPVGPVQARPLGDGASLQGARAALRSLLEGEPGSAGDAMAGVDASALERLGISAQQLRDALERFSRGDAGALDALRDALDRVDRALREADALRDAREQVARAREGLGEEAARNARAGEGAAAAAQAGGDEGAGGAGEDEAGGGEADASGQRPGAGRAAGPREATPAPGAVPGAAPGPTLQVRGTPREGGVFVSEARVLPRAGDVRTSTEAIDARFAAQVEEVLARDQYPVHYKQFIRRYFLSLSEGLRGEGQEP